MEKLGILLECNYIVATLSAMEISIIPIGNSKGIRLPKTVLEKYQITDSVDMVLHDEFIMLKPVTQPRKGWDEAFAKMHAEGDDKLLIDDIFEDEDFE